MEYWSQETLEFLERERSKLKMKNVLVMFGPETGILVVCALEYAVSFSYLIFNILNRMGRLEDRLAELGKFFRSYNKIVATLSDWIVFDRTVMVLCTTCVLVGHLQNRRSLFLPYLIWSPVQLVANGITVFGLSDSSTMAWLIPWTIICFEVNSWINIYSHGRLLRFREMVTFEYEHYLKRAKALKNVGPPSDDADATNGAGSSPIIGGHLDHEVQIKGPDQRDDHNQSKGTTSIPSKPRRKFPGQFSRWIWSDPGSPQVDEDMNHVKVEEPLST